MSIFDFCTIPPSVVETLLVPYPTQKIAAAVRDVESEGAKLGSVVIQAALIGAGAGAVGRVGISAARFSGRFEDLAQDYVDFYNMARENPRETLTEFTKFLGDSLLLASPFYGMQGVLFGPLMLMNGADSFDAFRCGMSLATFAVYPGPCDLPVPEVEVTQEDVKDLAVEAAKLAVPILGIL